MRAYVDVQSYVIYRHFGICKRLKISRKGASLDESMERVSGILRKLQGRIFLSEMEGVETYLKFLPKDSEDLYT